MCTLHFVDPITSHSDCSVQALYCYTAWTLRLWLTIRTENSFFSVCIPGVAITWPAFLCVRGACASFLWKLMYSWFVFTRGWPCTAFWKIFFRYKTFNWLNISYCIWLTRHNGGILSGTFFFILLKHGPCPNCCSEACHAGHPWCIFLYL